MGRIVELSDGSVQQAIGVVDGGGLVVLPTMTNYNVVCDSTDADAIDRVFRVKSRTKLGPLPLNVRGIEQLVEFALVPEDIDLSLLRRIWPTELCLIFHQRYAFPERLTCGLGTIACSQTAHPVLAAVQRGMDRPLACTSANRSGFSARVVTFEIAVEHVGDAVDLVINGGATPAALLTDERPIVNTIVDLTFSPPMLCRAGWFSLDRVRQLFPDVVVDSEAYQRRLIERQRQL